MFKRMSLAKKLVTGFAIVLVLLVVVGVVSFQALTSASSGFERYSKLANDSALMGQVQANMLMVRMSVKDFISSGGNPDNAKAYEGYMAETRAFVDEAQEIIHDPERAAAVDTLDNELKEYEEFFAKLVDYDHEYDTHFDVLVEKGPIMEENLAAIMSAADRDGNAAAAYRAGLALRHMLLGRINIFRFMMFAEQKNIDDFVKEFAFMQEQLDILERHIATPDLRRMLDEVASLVTLYRDTVSEKMAPTTFKRDELVASVGTRLGNSMPS